MIRSLAYVGFGSPAAEEWRSFGPEVLGLQLTEDGADGSVRLRNDDAAWRLAICPQERDALAFIGWDTGGAEQLAAATDRLQAAGVEMHPGDGGLAADRAVAEVAWFTDPFGFRHELVHGQRRDPGGFQPGRAGVSFVTGEGGLGHLVLIVPDFDAANRFFIDLLGFRHSDDIDLGFTVRFLHCNPRHHTLAFSTVPGKVGVHHLMVEVTDRAAVEAGYELVQQRGLPLAMKLGQHTNDHMTSFYVRTPSGFEIEYGTGGRLLPLAEPWTPEHYDAMSTWGHEPPEQALLPGILGPAAS